MANKPTTIWYCIECRMTRTRKPGGAWHYTNKGLSCCGEVYAYSLEATDGKG